MATRKPRIIITVEPEVNDLFDDLSDLTGKPKARFVSDLIQEALPALYEVRDALQNLENKKSALPNVANMVRIAGISNLKINDEVVNMINQIDMFEEDKDD